MPETASRRHSSVRTRLAVVLVALLLVAVAGSAASYVLVQMLMGDVAARGGATAMLEEEADGVVYAAYDEEAAIRDFLLTGDITYFEAYGRSVATADQLLERMARYPDAPPNVMTAIGKMQKAVAEWRTTSAEPVLTSMQEAIESDTDTFDPTTEIERLGAGGEMLTALRGARDELQMALGEPGTDYSSGLSALAAASLIAFGVTLLSLVVAAVAASFLITRWVTLPLDRLVNTTRRLEAGADEPFEGAGLGEIGELGRALERMRRHQREQQEATARVAERSDVLNRYTEATSFVTEDAALSHATLEALDELTHPSDAAVHVSNRSRDRAAPEATLGDVHPPILSLGAIATCPGVIRGSAFVAPDVQARLAVRCPVYAVEGGTLACVPLVALGEMVGVVHLHWDVPGALPLELLGPLDRVSSHAALSIANRRMVTALRGMAAADPRTGLLNSRGFDEVLEKELVAWRQGEEAALLMLDLDHFKDFNDRYGHPAGDEALRAFAGVLRACLRDEDVAARYGGEEFVVLLRGLGPEQGRGVAERIRARTESTILSLAPGVTGRITVSAGGASVPFDGLQRVPLLRAADSALYRAKEGGRNRVEWSTSGAVEPAADAVSAAGEGAATLEEELAAGS